MIVYTNIFGLRTWLCSLKVKRWHKLRMQSVRRGRTGWPADNVYWPVGTLYKLEREPSEAASSPHTRPAMRVAAIMV